jgi:hypothetical protein
LLVRFIFSLCVAVVRADAISVETNVRKIQYNSLSSGEGLSNCSVLWGQCFDFTL